MDDRTLSTTGKPVINFYFGRQRSLIELVFHVLSSVAQQWACVFDRPRTRVVERMAGSTETEVMENEEPSG